MPTVYILRCRDGSLYTGATTDLSRRLQQHAAGTASRYTRGRLPVALAWSRQVASWSEALREERRIKALPRAEKQELVASVARAPGPARRAAGPPRSRSGGRTRAGSSRS